MGNYSFLEFLNCLWMVKIHLIIRQSKFNISYISLLFQNRLLCRNRIANKGAWRQLYRCWGKIHCKPHTPTFWRHNTTKNVYNFIPKSACVLLLPVCLSKLLEIYPSLGVPTHLQAAQSGLKKYTMTSQQFWLVKLLT